MRKKFQHFAFTSLIAIVAVSAALAITACSPVLEVASARPVAGEPEHLFAKVGHVYTLDVADPTCDYDSDDPDVARVFVKNGLVQVEARTLGISDIGIFDRKSNVILKEFLFTVE